MREGVVYDGEGTLAAARRCDVPKTERQVVIMFRNGTSFKHLPLATDDELWKMVTQLTSEMNKKPSGLLALTRPYGVHRVSDISSVLFGDAEPPPDTPPMGFQASG